MKMENNIRSIIDKIKILNKKYKEIEKIKGENFNIFSILKLERNEVKTHSNFIYELLNPRGSHNQGSLFLELFLQQVLKLSDCGSNDKIKVHQEYLTTDNRRIDFVIESEKYQIGIEMKIDAGDQVLQLSDYMQELKKAKKEEKLYYLTLNGHEASDESLGKNKPNYKRLSFKEDIYDWLLLCIEKSVNSPLLREGLTHYKNLIVTITNKISKPMEQEMKKLIRTPDDIEAVQAILDEYPRIWASKKMDFFDRLDKKLKNIYEENNFEFLDVYDIWTDEKEEEHNDRIGNLVLKELSGFVLKKKYDSGYSIELHFHIDSGKLDLLIALEDKVGTRILANEAMIKIFDILGFRRKSGLNRYKNIKENITFFSKKQTTLTYDLFDTNKFNGYIEEVAKEIETAIVYLVDNEDKVLEALHHKQT